MRIETHRPCNMVAKSEPQQASAELNACPLPKGHGAGVSTYSSNLGGDSENNNCLLFYFFETVSLQDRMLTTVMTRSASRLDLFFWMCAWSMALQAWASMDNQGSQ